MKTLLHTVRRGFTMAELMIVIAIIGIIMGIGILPYGEYMRQATLSSNVDIITQEWILAHKEVRNGIQKADKHQNVILKITKDTNIIEKYLVDAKDNNGKKWFGIPWSWTNPDKKIELDSKIKFLKFTNSDGSENSQKIIYYFIEAPEAEWKFYIEQSEIWGSITATIGYSDTKSKEIILQSLWTK